MYNKYKYLIPTDESERAPAFLPKVNQNINYLETLPKEMQEEITKYVDLPTTRTINKSLYNINKERFCDNFKFIHNSKGILANYNSNEPFIMIKSQDDDYWQVYNASINNILIDNYYKTIGVSWERDDWMSIQVVVSVLNQDDVQISQYNTILYDIDDNIYYDLDLLSKYKILKNLGCNKKKIYLLLDEKLNKVKKNISKLNTLPLNLLYTIIKIYIYMFTTVLIIDSILNNQLNITDFWEPFGKKYDEYIFTEEMVESERLEILYNIIDKIYLLHDQILLYIDNLI